MTRPLRKLHLAAWLVLGPLLLLVLIIAIANKPAKPVQEPPDTVNDAVKEPP